MAALGRIRLFANWGFNPKAVASLGTQLWRPDVGTFLRDANQTAQRSMVSPVLRTAFHLSDGLPGQRDRPADRKL